MMRDLADKLGMTEVGLSKSLNGNPTVSRLMDIANVLGVDFIDLFDKPSGVNGYIELNGVIHNNSSVCFCNSLTMSYLQNEPRICKQLNIRQL